MERGERRVRAFSYFPIVPRALNTSLKLLKAYTYIVPLMVSRDGAAREGDLTIGKTASHVQFFTSPYSTNKKFILGLFINRSRKLYQHCAFQLQIYRHLK